MEDKSTDRGRRAYSIHSASDVPETITVNCSVPDHSLLDPKIFILHRAAVKCLISIS